MKHLGLYLDNKDISTKDKNDAKQDTLVSGTSIKTINGLSVLGSGDLAVGGTSVVKATGAEINAGTDDAKYATPKALLDSNLINSANGSTTNIITLTKAQYDALTPAQKAGNTYITTDEPEASLAVATATVNGLVSLNFLLNTFYPVGTIYQSINNVNPSTFMGGTWVAWGTGRTPVGVDSGQTEFSTVEKTGGHKLLQSHKHNRILANGDAAFPMGMTGVGAPDTVRGVITQIAATTAYALQTENTGGGNAENLQPYITCYFWKRTA